MIRKSGGFLVCTMKKIIFFLFIISVTNAQWEYETATIIDKGRKEIGIFSPFRVGLQNGMELSINKFIIMPTISISNPVHHLINGQWLRNYN